MQIESVLSALPGFTVTEGGGPEAHSSVGPLLEVGPIRVDLLTFAAFNHVVQLPLTRIEFDILVHLMRNAHRVVSPQELVKSVTGGVYSAESSLVRVHISRLRRKLGGASQFIRTVRGRGFRFNVESSR